MQLFYTTLKNCIFISKLLQNMDIVNPKTSHHWKNFGLIVNIEILITKNESQKIHSFNSYKVLKNVFYYTMVNAMGWMENILTRKYLSETLKTKRHKWIIKNAHLERDFRGSKTVFYPVFFRLIPSSVDVDARQILTTVFYIVFYCSID